MRVFVDNQVCDVPADCVGDAIAGAAALAEQQGRMITEVFVDDEPWAEERITADASATATADEVRLITADPVDLVARALDDAVEALSVVDRLQQEAAAFLEEDDSDAAMDRFGTAVSLWINVQKAVTMSAQVMQWDLDAQQVGPDAPRATIDRLNGRLRVIRTALENQDPIGLSDALRYEMPQVVQQWESLLGRLRDSLQQGERHG